MTKKLADQTHSTGVATGSTSSQSSGVTLLPTYGTPTPAAAGGTTGGGTSSTTSSNPPPLATLLSNAQADVTAAQDAYANIVNDVSILEALAPLAQSFIQQATSGNPAGTQSQLDSAHAVAAKMQRYLTDVSSNATKASNASDNAYQQSLTAFNEGYALATAPANPSYTALQAAAAQAKSTAASATAAANSAEVVGFALLAQGILGITRPGPQTLAASVSGPSLPSVAPVSFHPRGIMSGFPGYVLGLKLNESDTQSLITFLKNNDGGSASTVIIGGLVSVAESVVAALITGDLSVPSLIGAIVKMLAQLEVSVVILPAMTAADNKALGVTLNFSLTTLGVAAAAGAATQELALTAAAVFAKAEANLIAEKSHPGGCGDWTDGFWITGNTS